MTRNFNTTLGQYFSQVHGQRGKGKHRCLLAKNDSDTESAALVSNEVRNEVRNKAVRRSAGGTHAACAAETLAAFGGVFSGADPDRGGQLLAQSTVAELRTVPDAALSILDFGCGNGAVAKFMLEQLGNRVARLVATDIDLDAFRTSSENLKTFPQVSVTWEANAASVADNSIDVVLLNPPFHTETAVDLTLVEPMLDAALRVLKAGGTLFLVHNSHARYRPLVEKRFSRVRQITRTATFTVLAAN